LPDATRCWWVEGTHPDADMGFGVIVYEHPGGTLGVD
jgi:hypothetical protein